MSKYDVLTNNQQFACRVIADHARAAAFAIADGILPGNGGRNSVLRKIMRRAIYQGREHLDLKDAFFYKVCDLVVDQMRAAYPELENQRDFIGKIVRIEEEQFGHILTEGLSKVNALLAESKKSVEEGAPIQVLPRNVAYLYDTNGIPIDFMYVVLSDNRIILRLNEHNTPYVHEMDGEEFRKHIETALQRLQTLSEGFRTKSQPSPIYSKILEKVGANKFHGYDTTQVSGAKVVGILDGETRKDSLTEGEQGSVVLDQTPFYAESGGQVGDTGTLVRTAYGSGRLNVADTNDKPPATAGGSDFSATVVDTYSPIAGIVLHKSKVERGSIKVGDTVTATVDVEKRDATRRNHTATHLVHAALKEVLGSHVKQAGSVVSPSYLRFDFTHYQPMTDGEVNEVEDLVNRYILQNEPVTTSVMALEKAMRSGAVAMFGEKYGGEVRVLSVGDGAFSKELCGGTHVRATGDIGSFKITSDEAIASGVRRIRAITGLDAFERFREDERLIDASLGALNAQRDNLPNAIAKLADELKKTRKEMDELKLKIATGTIGEASSNSDEAREIGGVKVLAKQVDGLDANGTRQLSDTLLARLKSGVVILGRASEGKVSIIVRVSDDLTDKVKAGNIIKEIVPIVGGKGGGRADMAEGGGTEPAKLADAIEAAYGVVEKMLV